MNRLVLKLLPWALAAILVAYIVIDAKLSGPADSKDSTIITHNMIVEKIVQLGKLELTKIYVKDVMEQQEVKDWWPDSKVILIISGEVTACVDLSKVDSTKIRTMPDKIEITLPQPEICQYKVDHSKSKVYSFENGWSNFEKSKLIDKAYAAAEKNLLKVAQEMKLNDQAKAQAITFLSPFLQQVGGKKVSIVFQ